MDWFEKIYGRIFSADIIVSKIIKSDQTFGVADPEFIGVMPVRQDIQVLSADEPRRLSIGWRVEEIVGVPIINARCLFGENNRNIYWAQDLLRLRLVPYDGEWALIRPMWKKLPPYQNLYPVGPRQRGFFADYTECEYAPDYNDIANATVVHRSKEKADLEKMQVEAQTLIDNEMYDEPALAGAIEKMKNWIAEKL